MSGFALPSVQVPQLVIPLAGVPVGVRHVQGEGDAVAQIVIGPMMVQFVLPLTGAGAKNVASALQAAGSGIVVAGAAPEAPLSDAEAAKLREEWVKQHGRGE